MHVMLGKGGAEVVVCAGAIDTPKVRRPYWCAWPHLALPRAFNGGKHGGRTCVSSRPSMEFNSVLFGRGVISELNYFLGVYNTWLCTRNPLD